MKLIASVQRPRRSFVTGLDDEAVDGGAWFKQGHVFSCISHAVERSEIIVTGNLLRYDVVMAYFKYSG